MTEWECRESRREKVSISDSALRLCSAICIYFVFLAFSSGMKINDFHENVLLLFEQGNLWDFIMDRETLSALLRNHLELIMAWGMEEHNDQALRIATNLS